MRQDMKTLLDAACGGDNNAYTQLYEMTFPRALGMARSMLKSEEDAMDVVQESYIYAFRSLDQLKSPESFPSWFNTIVVSRSKNVLTRSKARRYEVSLTDEEGEDFDWEDSNIQFRPDESLDYSETKRLVKEIVDDLPEEQRTCILLYYFQDMKIREIAETMEVSENTVKSRLGYAKKKIEKDVRELERRGTRLYAVPFIPFLRWMVEKDTLALAEKGSGAILANIAQSVGLTAQGAGAAGTSAAVSAGSSTAASAGSATAASATASTAAAATESVAATTTSAAGTATVKAGVLHTLGGKIAVGVLAAAVAAGGGAAVAAHSRQEQPPAVEVEAVRSLQPVEEEFATPAMTPQQRAQAVFEGTDIEIRDETTPAARITVAIDVGFGPKFFFDSHLTGPVSSRDEAGGLGTVSADDPAFYETIRERLLMYGYDYQSDHFGLVKAFNDYRGVETNYMIVDEKVDDGWKFIFWSYDKAADVFTLAGEVFVPETEAVVAMVDEEGPAPNIEGPYVPEAEEPEEEEPEEEPEPVEGGDIDEWLRLVNAARAEKGRGPVTVIDELMELAEERAEELLRATDAEIYSAGIAGEGIELMRPYDDRSPDRTLATVGEIHHSRVFSTAQSIVDYDLRYVSSSPLYTKDEINVGVGYYQEDGVFLWIMVEVWFD